jgi:hypothetical protein
MTTTSVLPAHVAMACSRCRILENRNVPCLRTGARKALAHLPDLVGVLLFTGSLLMVSAFVATMS